MFYSDNPDKDFDRYDMAMAQKEAMLPKCEKCGEPIHDDVYYEINGEILCESCVQYEYGRSTQDYLDNNY